MTEDEHIWACALAVEKTHGLRAGRHVTERIGALMLVGDAAGVAMWRAIAARLAKLQDGNRPS